MAQNKMYLDIETLPAHEDQHEALKFLHNKRRLKKNGGDNCVDEKTDFEQYLLSTSVDGSFGRILCIGYAINNDPVDIIYSENEKEILEKFWTIAKDMSLFVGHNILDFDLRFIYQRSIVNGVRPSVELNFARYRNFPIYDTMREWVKWANVMIGLEHVALALGIPTPKDGIDGSQVYSFYQKGKVQDILEYCKRDVEVTRAVYKRMTYDFTGEINRSLFEKEKVKKEKVSDANTLF